MKTDIKPYTIKFTEISNFESTEFMQALQIYSNSFPPVEMKPVDIVLRLLKDDNNYHLCVGKKSDLVVCMSLLCVFQSFKIGFVDYIAVEQDFRAKGIGTEFLRFVEEELCKHVTCLIGWIVEVQKENIGNLKERKIREERIRYYEKMGAQILDRVNYFLPPQIETVPEEMYLMFKPLKKVKELPGKTVLELIKNIYLRVYQREETELINEIAGKMPKKVGFRSLFL